MTLTNERRKALINYCKESIEKYKAHLSRPLAKTNLSFRAQVEGSLAIAEIALASLTAEPADRIISDGCGQQIGGIPASETVNCVWSIGTVFYTAPPVPVIRLPGNLQDAFEEGNRIPTQTSRCGNSYCSHSFSNWDGQKFMNEFDGFVKGINFIKRLNGLGE